MSAKKPLAGIKILLLIIPLLFYFAPPFQHFSEALITESDTTQSDHPQSKFNEISTTFYHAAKQHEIFYVQEAEKFVTLDNSIYLSYQVFLI